MPPLLVNIDLPESIRPQMEWSWDLFCCHFQIPYRLNRSNIGDLLISTEKDEKADIKISKRTLEIVEEQRFDHENVFPEEPVIRSQNGQKDILGTAFYMVNSLQEYPGKTEDLDELGRFKYRASYQYKFDVVERDLVSELFEELRNSISDKIGEETSQEVPACFLTHDVDRIAQGNPREAYHRLKKGKIGKTIRTGLHWMLGKHEWDNMEEILSLHESFGFRSSFFWLTEKGRDHQNVLNADYDIQSPRYKRVLKEIKNRGFTNGLHKSTFQKDLSEEFKKINEVIPINRNHYLKFKIPDHYKNLDDAEFLLDTSLAFSERMGFRNNYGKPFHPFDDRNGKAMELLEVPLNIMDITLFRDQESPFEEASRFIRNAREGAVLTFLWHNNALTDGKFTTWKETYIRLLELLKEQEFPSKTAFELRERHPSSFTS